MTAYATTLGGSSSSLVGGGSEVSQRVTQRVNRPVTRRGRPRFRGRWLVAVLGLVVALGGCEPSGAGTTAPPPTTSAPTNPTNPPTPTPPPTTVPGSSRPQTNPLDRAKIRDGGVLRLGVTGFPASWNPWGMSVFDLPPAVDALTPRLYARAADGTMAWDPDWLAGEPVVSYPPKPTLPLEGPTTEAPDGPAMTVAYDLNPRAVWSDGSPLTVADFQGTWWACATDPGPACLGRGFDHVTYVSEGATPAQVLVHYDQVWADWPHTFARGPFRADYVGDADSRTTPWDSLADKDWAFSGPYRFEGLDATAVRLARNPHWWGDTAKLETVVMSVVDPEGAELAYLRQDLDGFWVGDVNLFARASGWDGQVRRGSAKRARFLVMNCADGPLADPAVRRAVRAGLNRVALGASDLAGWKWGGSVLNSPIWVAGQPGYADLTQGLGTPTAFPAGGLLDAAGWVLGDDGVRYRDSVALAWDFLVPYGDDLAENEGFGLRTQLAGLGVRLNLVHADPADVPNLLMTRQYAMAAVTWEVTTELAAAARYTGDPGGYGGYGGLGSSGGPGNLMGFADREVDDLHQRALREPNPAQRAALLAQLAAVVWDQAPAIPLYELPEVFITRPALANFGPYALGTIPWEDVGWAA